MTITRRPATPDSLDEIVETMASWQHDGGVSQLHPGDLGWNWRMGTEELAATMRVWLCNGQMMAAGMVDADEGLVRMAIAPSVDQDESFAADLVADLADPAWDATGDRIESVEARFGAALRDLLVRSGWVADESWTPLSRNLTDTVEACGLRIEVVDAHHVQERIVADRVRVHRASFDNSTFTLQRWQAMAAASPYRRARCLVGYNNDDDAVAAVTVWSAGQGRPGLLEPMGVHRSHRGHGYGTAMNVAAASALQEMGCSSATVCTPSSNVGGVAAYVSAGYQQLPDVTDLRRPS